MRVVITGGRGMLGTALSAEFTRQGHRVLPLSRTDADITDFAACRKAIMGYKPELILHAAAMTDVDGCERDPDAAYRVNAIGAMNIAACAEEAGSRIAYISTDFVFDGDKSEPYTEFDATNPLGVYGSSKLAGEKLVREACPRAYIVRTSWLFGAVGKCFPKTIIRLAKTRTEFNVVADQFGTPTYVDDLSAAIADIIMVPRYGTYHVANSGEASWHEFAEAILEDVGIVGVSANPIPASDWPSPTTRPAYSVLRPYVRELLGKPPLRNWRMALQEYVAKGIPD